MNVSSNKFTLQITELFKITFKHKDYKQDLMTQRSGLPSAK